VVAADRGMVVVGGAMLILLVVLLTMGIVLAVRFLGFLLRLVTGGGRGSRSNLACDPARGAICSHRSCGHVNPSGARYCGRCGRPLNRHEDVDAYG
jgi:hypothetical protein